MTILDDGFLADMPVPREDGSIVSQKIDRVIELIQEYDPTLEVRWIPPRAREPGDAAFAIVSRQKDGREYVVLYVDSEEYFDHRVLGQLRLADNADHDVQSAMDIQNEAVRRLQRKRYEEAIEEANDLAAHIWRSPKHTYKHDGITYT